MKRVSFDDMPCSVAKTLEQVGEWWTLLIVRDAQFGVRRFEDFQRRLPISRNILATRLDKLVSDGIFERRQYQDNPPRHEYLLTPKGKDLWQVLTMLRQWGDRWAVEDGQESTVLRHTECGHDTTAVLTCSHCGDELHRSTVRVLPGPGPGAAALFPVPAH